VSFETPSSAEPAVRRRFPFATCAAAAVNAAFFAATLAEAGARARIFAHLAHVRERVWEGEWWRLFTGTFLHDGPLHFFWNMAILVLLGRIVEPILGSWRFAAVYAGAGLGGALVFQAASPAGLGIGASGAVCGIAGAFFRLWWIAASRRGSGRFAVIFTLAVLLALDQIMAAGLAQAGVGIAVSAHAGGLFSGLLLAYALRAGEGPDPAGAGSAVRGPALAGFALAAGLLAAYGGFYTWHDPAWHAHRKQRAVEELLDGQDPGRAVEAWKEARVGGRLDRGLGYHVCDGLLALGRRDLALPVLDLLIADVEAEIAARLAARNAIPPELVNEAAWYAAVKGDELGAAFKMADDAVQFLEAEADRGWLARWAITSVLAACLNTRGWLALHLGSAERGLRDLARAAELDPSGPHLLYFALALWQEGDPRRAREVARRAESAGELSRHERRLLDDLREDAGGW
jgi:membrane associated rhomboid family serine protease